jgi:hypothetical protein
MIYRDKDILQKSGQDAIQYLSFQRYLIIYTTVVMVLTVVIIIPVNFSGSNSKSPCYGLCLLYPRSNWFTLIYFHKKNLIDKAKKKNPYIRFFFKCRKFCEKRVNLYIFYFAEVIFCNL